jgi:hypothetical protein
MRWGYLHASALSSRLLIEIADIRKLTELLTWGFSAVTQAGEFAE